MEVSQFTYAFSVDGHLGTSQFGSSGAASPFHGC